MKVTFLDLKNVKVSAREQKELMDAMSNLPKLNENLKDGELFDLDTVRKCLKIEVDGKKRPATISRLLGRYKTLAGKAMDAEVYGS